LPAQGRKPYRTESERSIGLALLNAATYALRRDPFRNGRTPANTGMDFETVRQIAMHLPDVEESITRWGWTFRVRGKLLACQAVHRSAERDSLGVRIGFEDRARLLSAEPDKFYVTPHYVPYPMILVRVPKIGRAGMRSVLQLGWSFVTADAGRVRRSRGARKTSRKRLPSSS
jgi:hypothetical protein